jgi:type I restriction enzyme R subunit
MILGPEYITTEKPFLDQLAGMGWKVLTGSLDEPATSARDSFRDVLLTGELRAALRRTNVRDGEPWLDEGRISQAVSALERIGAPRLMEANQQATELLLTGIAVEGLPDWDQGRSRTVHYIDWERPENNVFTAVNQFRVDCPGGLAKEFVVPDLVLFVNGIPVVVVECKSPAASEPISSAIDQLRRYSNQRKAAGEVAENEGNERLFHTNQLLVATCYDEARAGTVGADAEHYLQWKDTAPVPLAEVAHGLGKETLSSQERLVAGMLRPAHLLDLLRHFTVFAQVSGRTVKIVGRYQQFRAVQAAARRLLHGKTRHQDGEHDRRGGIIWHTQGSGKSLTMVFLVRKMRSLPELRRFKVVIVTDRKDLQRQLSDTAALTGETVQVGHSVEEVKALLARQGPGLVFAMIQKYQERDLEDEARAYPVREDVREGFPRAAERGGVVDLDSRRTGRRGAAEARDLGVLNEDEAILLLVDEAHRSHTNTFHANLLKALPNCARIGFTGTPILMGAKKRTHDIFGAFLDRYTIKESEEDGVTVPILYEGRTASGSVADGRDLDQLFEDLFHDKREEELEAIRRKYATRGHVLEAPLLIEAKARDILRHYVEHILPNALKAQVVAYSRLAAIRYHGALTQARDELAAEARALTPRMRRLDDEMLAGRPAKIRAAVRAWRSLDLLERLEFAPVISADNNDDPAWREWTDGARIEARIARFKKPLLHEDLRRTDPLAFLLVKSMLLTGFDAPVEGVMYLDRPIKEAELLQAIARVNRTGHGKSAGIVVDYYGVARHLKEALAAYSEEDIEGALQSLEDEIPKLRGRHQRTLDLFRSRGIEDLTNSEACVQLLEDERLRAEFAVKLKQFLTTLDLVLPRPEGLPFGKDAKTLAFIYARARNRYKEGLPYVGKSVGAKVRKLLDEHVVSLGIDPKIPPISLTDADFADHVSKQVSSRAQASEMEHATRHHIRQHLHEDPIHYQKLSERLEAILQEFGDNWDALVQALQGFVEEVRTGRQEDETGLDPATQAPFFAVLKEERKKERAVSEADAKWLTALTVQLVEHVRAAISVIGFWRNATRQEELRGEIFMFLDEHGIVEFERADAVADRLMELAKANRVRLVGP